MGKRTIKTNNNLILYEKFKYNQSLSIKREDFMAKKANLKNGSQKEKRIKKFIEDGIPITIAITSLCTNSGCTFLSNAFADYLKSLNYSVIKTDKDSYDPAEYKEYNFIIFDAGKYTNISKVLEKSVLQAHIKIMVCLSSDIYLKELSQFIKTKENSSKWKFYFNKVLESEYKRLSDLMENYEYYLIPYFNHGDKIIEKELRNSFKSVLIANV